MAIFTNFKDAVNEYVATVHFFLGVFACNKVLTSKHSHLVLLHKVKISALENVASRKAVLILL